MKPGSVEEAIARIKKDLEENEIPPDESVICAAPTEPGMPTTDFLPLMTFTMWFPPGKFQ